MSLPVTVKGRRMLSEPSHYLPRYVSWVYESAPGCDHHIGHTRARAVFRRSSTGSLAPAPGEFVWRVFGVEWLLMLRRRVFGCTSPTCLPIQKGESILA